MNHRVGLYIKCRKCLILVLFVGVTYGFTVKTKKELQDQRITTALNKSLKIEVLNATTSNPVLQERIIDNITTITNLEDLNNYETETEVNLEHVRKRLNDEDLYEHVTDKNNVSQRSFVFIPASKFKIPYLNPLSRPQKTMQSAYDKTFIGNLEPPPYGDFALKYDEITGRKISASLKDAHEEPKPYQKVSVLDTPLYDSIQESPLENEMDTLTNKVKAANGIINMQYNNIKDKPTNVETQFYGQISDENGYFKDDIIKMFKFNKINKKPHDSQISDALYNDIESKLKTKNYPLKQFPEEHLGTNSTGANVNDVNFMGDRYDYIELIKPALLRPVDKKKPFGMKNTLFDNLKLDSPLQSSPNQYERLSDKSYNNVILEPHESRFTNLKPGSNLKSQTIDSVVGSDNRNANKVPLSSLIKPEQFDSNTNRKNINASRLGSINLSGTSLSGLQSQSHGSISYGNSNRSPMKESSEKLESSDPKSEGNSSMIGSNSKVRYRTKPTYHTRLFHDSFGSIGKPQNNFKQKLVDSKTFGQQLHTKGNHFSEYPLRKENPYKQNFKNNIVPYKITNKLKEQNKILTNSYENENTVKAENKNNNMHIDFYPENIDEPVFHTSLLAQKFQEMRDLSKQLNDENKSHESDKREMDPRKYAQDQKNKNGKKLATKGKTGCVYPDCAIRQLHKYFIVKPHEIICDCDLKQSTSSVDISHNGQITPVFINASTDFEV